MKPACFRHQLLHLCGLAWMMLAILATCLYDAGAQSGSPPAYIKFRKATLVKPLPPHERDDRSANRMAQMVKDDGLPAFVYDNGDGTGLILVGPYTSRADFDAAIQRITKSWGWLEQSTPFYLPETGAPNQSEDSTDTRSASTQQPPARPSRSTTELAALVTQAIKERGGVFQGIRIEPTGVTSDAIGPNHSFEARPAGIILNYVYESSLSVIYWKEIRSIQLLPNGAFEIFAPIHSMTRTNPGNPMNPRGGFDGSSWDDLGSSPAHLRFILATNNPQDNIRILSAMRQLAITNETGSTN